MAVSDAYVFPGFLTSVLTQLFFPKPPTTFFTCFCRGERQKYAGKKSHLNWGSNSQTPDHESDTLTTEPPGRGTHLEIFLPLSSNLKLSSANSFSLEESKICCLGKVKGIHSINRHKYSYSSLNDKIQDLSKLKAFADDK